MSLEKHDWVKGRSSESATGAIEPASSEEVARAMEMVKGDPILADDPWTAEVIANDGVVTIEKTGLEVAVDLIKFIEARRAFIAYHRVTNLDPVLAQIAASRPDERDVVKTLQ